MSKVQDVQERLHYPVYDCFFVPHKNANGDARRFGDAMTDSRMIRFFVDVQNKTRLETNLQASGVLPSRNQFEARALRVVVSTTRRLLEEPSSGAPMSEAELINQVIYNSVTTLIVGEKVMIEMPTFYFPSGGGVTTAAANVSGHGVADPRGTFTFAEPVRIDPQQNFRVEMSFPQGLPGGNAPEPRELAGAQGPIRVWVVLDGYLTRDVQ